MATHFYRCKLRAHNLNKIYIWLVGFCLQLKAKDLGITLVVFLVVCGRRPKTKEMIQICQLALRC